jgi:hypothetical protein
MGVLCGRAYLRGGLLLLGTQCHDLVDQGHGLLRLAHLPAPRLLLRATMLVRSSLRLSPSLLVRLRGRDGGRLRPARSSPLLLEELLRRRKGRRLGSLSRGPACPWAGVPEGGGYNGLRRARGEWRGRRIRILRPEKRERGRRGGERERERRGLGRPAARILSIRRYSSASVRSFPGSAARWRL